MRWNLVESMQEGVLKSEIVLACIRRDYEKSQNCMFEQAESCKLANKPIVTLSTDPFSWAGSDLKQMCGISGQKKMFFDIGEICERPGWGDEPDFSNLDPNQLRDIRDKRKQNIRDLITNLDKLVKILEGDQINCFPSFMK